MQLADTTAAAEQKRAWKTQAYGLVTITEREEATRATVIPQEPQTRLREGAGVRERGIHFLGKRRGECTAVLHFCGLSHEKRAICIFIVTVNALDQKQLLYGLLNRGRTLLLCVCWLVLLFYTFDLPAWMFFFWLQCVVWLRDYFGWPYMLA